MASKANKDGTSFTGVMRGTGQEPTPAWPPLHTEVAPKAIISVPCFGARNAYAIWLALINVINCQCSGRSYRTLVEPFGAKPGRHGCNLQLTRGQL